MPAPEYKSSQKELISIMRNKAVGSRDYVIAESFLKMKNQGTMTRATWVVGFATVGLIISTAVEILAILGS